MDSGIVGWLALWGAIAAAITSCGAHLAGDRPRARTIALQAAVAAAGLAGLAVGALAWSLLAGNLALAYVADTTTRVGSWPYRLAGLWGGNGGSLLLWASLVLAVGVAATARRRPARVAVVATGAALLLVDAVAANPFARLAIPAIDGVGLTPILQYPAMLYHPLLLYVGLAALVAPFALTLAGLATGRLDEPWQAASRRWMLVGWLLLGVALVAGAHWAYVELGWGGFWAWDPVENSGLLPWLAATAFVHRARATKEGRPGIELAGLAALPFAIALVGATVSRSGAAQSVHGFAEAAAVGRGLLAVVVAALTVTTVLLVRAGRRRPAQGGGSAGDSQRWALAAAVVLLLAVALVVLVGTVFPVMVHAFAGQTVEVTTRYYAMVVTPLAALALALMGFGPAFGQPALSRRMTAAVLVATAVGVLFARSGLLAPAALGGAAALAGILALTELVPGRHRSLRRAGALLAHAGLAVLLLGTAGSLLGRHVTEVVRPGGQVSVHGYTLRYRALVADQGPSWRRVRMLVDVRENGHLVTTLTPGLRFFDNQAGALSDVALRSTAARDLIVAVRAIDAPTRAATLEVTVRPLVTLVWWGGLLAAGGGGLVLVAAWRPARRRPPPGNLAAPFPASAPGTTLVLEETVDGGGR